MTDLDLTEATAAAAVALHEAGYQPSVDWSPDVEQLARVATPAAAAVVERQVRERITADILAVILSVSNNTLGVTEKQELILNGLRQALSIARGGGS